jgi:hypothetical protein
MESIFTSLRKDLVYRRHWTNSALDHHLDRDDLASAPTASPPRSTPSLPGERRWSAGPTRLGLRSDTGMASVVASSQTCFPGAAESVTTLTCLSRSTYCRCRAWVFDNSAATRARPAAWIALIAAPERGRPRSDPVAAGPAADATAAGGGPRSGSTHTASSDACRLFDVPARGVDRAPTRPVSSVPPVGPARHHAVEDR